MLDRDGMILNIIVEMYVILNYIIRTYDNIEKTTILALSCSTTTYVHTWVLGQLGKPMPWF